MPKIVKGVKDPLTEDMVKGLIGHLVHVPVNIHTVPDMLGEGTKRNVWFAGKVAGYEKVCIAYDIHKREFIDEPKVFFNVLLVDGMSYALSPDGDVEITIITEEEYEKLLAEYVAREAVSSLENKIIEVRQSKKILKPGEDF